MNALGEEIFSSVEQGFFGCLENKFNQRRSINSGVYVVRITTRGANVVKNFLENGKATLLNRFLIFHL